MSQHPISISTGKFSLDISGVAGFFGGDEAVQAIQTIHLYKARRWTGWYNAPGSFAVAKCLGPIANNRFWNALFPGPNEDPETVFGIDNQPGPKYTAFQSGTIIDKTTHVTYLVARKTKEEDLPVTDVGRRVTRSMTLTVVEVTDTSRMQSSAPADSKKPPTVKVNVLDHNKWLAGIPIATSLLACALCAYNHDWYCLAMILLGIISNGLTCLVVGSASVVLKGVQPADHAPPGDGMLADDNSNHIIILKGTEKDVNWVTKGKFYLEYLPSVWTKKKHQGTRPSSGTSTGANSDPETALLVERPTESPKKTPGPEEYNKIGLCSLLLGIQSLLQVLLIPQGTLLGQVMFLSSFIISWAYNLYLSSLDKEKVQQRLLFQTLKVKSTSRFKLGTRTTAAVFTTLVLRSPAPGVSQPSQPSSAIKFLKSFLPNETAVWEKWREHVGKHIETIDWTGDTDESEVSTKRASLKNYSDTSGLSEKDKSLLEDLLNDAGDAFDGYYNYLIQEKRRLSGNQAVGGGGIASSQGRPGVVMHFLGTMGSVDSEFILDKARRRGMKNGW